jgi:AcrR family transcriptional regulator
MKASLLDIHPRKLPSQGRSLAVVEAVYEAAARILEETGLASLNTNVIAERAGVSVGSLYQYFPSKDAVVAGLLRRKRAELLADIRAVVQNHSDFSFKEATGRLIQAALRHQLERPGLARILEFAENYLPVDSETAALKVEISREIERFLAERGTARADIAANDITALSRGMIDAAGLRGEIDAFDLAARVEAAVLGYLERMAETGRSSVQA